MRTIFTLYRAYVEHDAWESQLETLLLLQGCARLAWSSHNFASSQQGEKCTAK